MICDDEELRRLGYLQLHPNMAILFRDLRGKGEPVNDVLKVWVEDERALLQEFHDVIERMKATIAILFGPDDELRGADKGGTALERSDRGNGNLQGDRCFTFANSKECPCMTHHPSKNMSQAHAKLEDDPMLRALSDYIKVPFFVF